MMTHFYWYLEPLSLHQLKKQKTKKLVKVGPPLTKLSGSAHTLSVPSMLANMISTEISHAGLFYLLGI